MATTAPANPVRGWANEHKILADNKYDITALGADNQNFKSGSLLTIDAHTVKVAEVGDPIEGVCKTRLVTESDNTTKAKRPVLYRRVHRGDSYRFSISLDTQGQPIWPVLTEADVFKYYQIDAEHFVDSASGDPADDTLPLQLIKIFEWGYEGEFIFTGV